MHFFKFRVSSKRHLMNHIQIDFSSTLSLSPASCFSLPFFSHQRSIPMAMATARVPPESDANFFYSLLHLNVCYARQ